MGYPHVYLIDGSGIIRRDYLYGPMTYNIFEGGGLGAEIARLLPAGAPEKR
jgi:hypothetical protein